MPRDRHSSHRSFKRLFDVVGATIGLILLLPLLVLISLVILWRDGRPVLHREYRLGRGDTLFLQLKFRTLRLDGIEGRSIAPEDDPRISAPGHWLRRWRLDEIPQLINVIVGDMSLVGPRPMPPVHGDALSAVQRAELLAVRPGLTDPAAIHFLAEDAVLAGYENAESIYTAKLLPAKTEMQIDYIRHRTWQSDLGVLVQTLRSVWSPAQRRRSFRSVKDLLH